MPFDRKQNFLHFPFPSPWAYLASFCSYGEKNEISENESWLLWQRPLKIQKSMLRSFIYSHSGTERWKPRENPSSESQDNWADRNYKKNNKIRKQNMWLTGRLLRRHRVVKQACIVSNYEQQSTNIKSSTTISTRHFWGWPETNILLQVAVKTDTFDLNL